MEWKTTHCLESISPKCPGHQGREKFSDCLSEAILYSGADECTGDIDGFGRWVGMFCQVKAEKINHPVYDIPVTIPAGFSAVLTEDDRGFIGWTVYDTAEAAQADFDRWEAAYADYREASDRREALIVSSTGRTGW